MYRHIIWDWNGTLFDDAWLCLDIINGLLSDRALEPITAEQYEQVFGFPVIEYYRKIGFRNDVEPFERISSAFILEYENRRAACQLRSSAHRTLSKFKHAGVSQSILSASKQAYLERAVEQFGICQFFTSINGIDNHHAAGKTELARNWMAAVKFDPQEVLLIGDTIHDFEVAQIIGVECILIYSGHQDRTRLMACGSKMIEDLADLSHMLAYPKTNHD
jgi:phosphoglycolate phosphatase